MKVRGDEAFVESGENVAVGCFSVQSCSSGCVRGQGTSDSASAEMLYAGDVWRTALRMPPPFTEWLPCARHGAQSFTSH